MRAKWFATASMLASLAAEPAISGAPAITDITEIPIHEGINHVEKFSPDGHSADILEAWRENLNAHSYHLFLIVGDHGVISFENTGGSNSGISDIVTDEPHTGEDVVRSVRFAHARVEGRPATLAIVATRRWKRSLADYVPVDFVVFQLQQRHGCCGTPDFFYAIYRETSVKSYGDADLALRDRFGLARTPTILQQE